MQRIIQHLENARKTGQVSVSTTAVPLTKVGDTSTGATTTYTTTTVTDATAWDLSAIATGDVAVTEDGYKGVVTAVDDTNDVVTVNYWVAPSGISGGSQKPTDGQTCTFHRIAQCKSIGIKALSGNTAKVYISTDGSATTSDYELSAGRKETLSNYGKPLDVTQVSLIAASGTQTVAWCVGAAYR